MISAAKGVVFQISATMIAAKRKIGIGERRQIAGRIGAEQHKIEKAVAVIEDEAPHLRRNHRRDRPGDEHDGAQQSPAAKDFVQHQRHAETEEQFQRDGDAQRKVMWSRERRAPRGRWQRSV